MRGDHGATQSCQQEIRTIPLPPGKMFNVFRIEHPSKAKQEANTYYVNQSMRRFGTNQFVLPFSWQDDRVRGSRQWMQSLENILCAELMPRGINCCFLPGGAKCCIDVPFSLYWKRAREKPKEAQTPQMGKPACANKELECHEEDPVCHN